jgi:pyruvate dehydrogenase complex dehydrogenase (E1) component
MAWRWRTGLIGIAGLLLAAGAQAERTVQDWLDAELHTRQLTLAGMEQRLQLQRQGATLDEQLQADQALQQQIAQIFREHGTTAADHLIWRHAQAEAIERWLQEHPQEREALRTLERRFEQLSAQLSGRAPQP